MKSIFCLFTVNLAATCPNQWSEEWTLNFGNYFKKNLKKNIKNFPKYEIYLTLNNGIKMLYDCATTALHPFQISKRAFNKIEAKKPEPCEPIMTDLSCKNSGRFTNRKVK